MTLQDSSKIRYGDSTSRNRTMRIQAVQSIDSIAFRTTQGLIRDFGGVNCIDNTSGPNLDGQAQLNTYPCDTDLKTYHLWKSDDQSRIRSADDTNICWDAY